MIDRKRTQRKEKIQLLQALLLRGHCSALNLNEAQKKKHQYFKGKGTNNHIKA